MLLHLKTMTVLSCLFIQVAAFATDIGCVQPAYDASDKASGCNPYAGTGAAGTLHGGGENPCDRNYSLQAQACKSLKPASKAASCSTNASNALTRCIKGTTAPVSASAADNGICGPKGCPNYKAPIKSK